MSALFSADDGAVRGLLDQMPLCWIVPHASPAAALLMPVVAEGNDAEAPMTLLGHLPLRVPAVEILAREPLASFLFLGPNAYVPPDIVGRDDWAPTWNFASARLTGTVEMDADLTERSVAVLTRLMEGADGWTMDRMGARADLLLTKIIGFRVKIGESVPFFKLGQDERPSDYARIRRHFGNGALGRWMDRLVKRKAE
ncbi:FMN-binding negative transcriptional regulator [uncultured Croceicoccus sp.]|uniref:FMN-binding negative transcriptional regulator n=1 Tax=uncultured Croceicoccus sp. TaxID=1295329 RepID=UPI00260DA8A1|nr:FMN-binding negative transcriptional regulator [uncultured Croceicoccus sp.]